MTIQKRFYITSFILMIFLFITGSISWWSLHRITETNQVLINKVLVQGHYVTELRKNLMTIRLHLRNLNFRGLTEEQKKHSKDRIQDQIEEYESNLKHYIGLGLNSEQQDMLKEHQAAWESFLDVGKEVLTLVKQDTDQSRDRVKDIFFGSCEEAAHRLYDIYNKIDRYHQAEVKQTKQKLAEVTELSNLLQILVVFTAIGLGIFVSYLQVKSLSKELKKNLKILTNSVSSSNQGTAQLQEFSEKLSQSVEASSSAVNEIAASMDEIRSMVESTAGQAEKLVETGLTVSKNSSEGGQIVAEVNQSFEEMKNSSDQLIEFSTQTLTNLESVNQIVEQIRQQTSVINEIVFQTKILSFNAQVEAARAGEYGRGFAVVAEEIGQLASSSGQAAREINDLLTKSNETVKNIIEDTKQQIDQLTASNQSIVAASEQRFMVLQQNFSQSQTIIEDLRAAIDAIKTATNEQNLGIQQISEGIHHIMRQVHSQQAMSTDLLSQAREFGNIAQDLSESHNKLARLAGEKNVSGDRHQLSKTAEWKVNKEHTPQVAA